MGCPWIDGCPIPSYDEDADIRILLNATYGSRVPLNGTYFAGTKVVLRVQNVSNRTYVYSTYYQSCQMTYHTEAGRQFKIPPGTHCDMIAYTEVQPGQTVELFPWDLDECTADDFWGCDERNVLPAGRYEVRSTFCRSDGGQTFGGERPWKDCGLGSSRSGASFTIS